MCVLKICLILAVCTEWWSAVVQRFVQVPESTADTEPLGCFFKLVNSCGFSNQTCGFLNPQD